MWSDKIIFDDAFSLTVAFFVAALVGLSKGGLGGTMAIIGVAVMSLIIPPIQAAAILLPILLIMDVIACWIWRGRWDTGMVMMLLPAGVLGVAFGWTTAAWVSDAVVRLIIGGMAMGYLLYYLYGLRGPPRAARKQDIKRGSFWSFFAGYGSFVAHSGGPAYQVYAMPLRASPAVFTATSTLFFAIINVAKTVPYAALGQFDTGNLITSLMLMPVAGLATFAGAAVVKRLRAEVFYPLMHVMLLLVTLKLIWDGVQGL